MITAMIIAVWFIAGTIAFRYIGYMFNENTLTSHPHQRICTRCVCTGCNQSAVMHYGNPCRGAKWTGIHFGAIAWAAMMAYPILPLTAIYFVVSVIADRTEFKFFKPLPEVKTRAERQEAKRASLDKRILELEKENARLAEELSL